MQEDLVTAAAFVEAELSGYHREDLSLRPGEVLATDPRPFVDPSCWAYFRLIIEGYALSSWRYYRRIEKAKRVKIHNARLLEKSEGLSKQAFFEKHGFVLLRHDTKMTEEDWTTKWVDCDVTQPAEGSGKYAKEVEALVAQMCPEAKDVKMIGNHRRGPDAQTFAFYIHGIHQDYGITAGDFARSGAEPGWRDRFDSADTKGFMVIDFWRPVKPMDGPLRDQPLALCDPTSVKLEDALIKFTHGYIEGGAYTFDLKYNQEHRWYYYPLMTPDEVLVFKQFQHFKSQTGPEVNTCAHTSFHDPTTPPGTEARRSSECRMGVWF